MLISDQFQGHGLGTELLRRLVRVGRDENLKRIVGYIALENDSMQGISRKLGFALHRLKEEGLIEAQLEL